MTEERDKYFNGISVEERAVRLAIKDYQSKIKNLKLNLTEWGDIMKEDFVLLHRKHITLYRKTINILKKQLPAPRVNCHCIVCGAVLVSWGNDKLNYCSQCGQKMK